MKYSQKLLKKLINPKNTNSIRLTRTLQFSHFHAVNSNFIGTESLALPNIYFNLTRPSSTTKRGRSHKIYHVLNIISLLFHRSQRCSLEKHIKFSHEKKRKKKLNLLIFHLVGEYFVGNDSRNESTRPAN